MAGTAQEVFDRFSPGPTYILKSSKEQLKKQNIALSICCMLQRDFT